MKHFKKPNGDIYGFELDGSQDYLITGDMVALEGVELDAHLNPEPIQPTAGEQLAATDAGMIRMIEDVTDVLIRKGLITESDLPQAAQDKLTNRKALRAQMK